MLIAVNYLVRSRGGVQLHSTSSDEVLRSGRRDATNTVGGGEAYLGTSAWARSRKSIPRLSYRSLVEFSFIGGGPDKHPSSAAIESSCTREPPTATRNLWMMSVRRDNIHNAAD